MALEELEPLGAVGGDEPADLQARKRQKARQRRRDDPRADPVRVEVAQHAARSGVQTVSRERRQQQQSRQQRAGREGRQHRSRQPRDRLAIGGRARRPAANGSSSGHDMWICISHATAAPITRKGRPAAAARRRLKPGSASKKPRKKRIAGARMYDVLMRCAENWIVHGNGEEPSPDQPARRRPAAVCTRTTRARRSPRTTAGSAGRTATRGSAATRSGRPTSSACSAPGISLRVQTTSGPKNGQAPVA